MSFLEDIRILLVKRNMGQAELANRLGDSRQNLGLKFKRNSIKDKDLAEICDALGVRAEITYRDKETGEIVYKNEV